MNIINIKTEYKDNFIIKIAEFGEYNLYYKFPNYVENDLTDRLDPFVYALIFPMMQIGGEFKFNGNISKSVLDNLEQFCKIWSIWVPNRYKSISIIANEIDDDYRPNNKNIISACSGGLDASYTLYKYKNNLVGRFNGDLKKSVMIYGADIPLGNEEYFKIAFNSAKQMTDDLNIDLIPVETNFRKIFNVNWEHCFGIFIVSVLNFFSKNFSIGVASDSSIKTYITPWGMNPITDRYFSNDTFKFIADGYEHVRTERASFIKNWQPALKNLRVCWENKDYSKNCGECEKCIRTKLNFKVNGVDHLPCMPTDFVISDLEKITLHKEIEYKLYEEIYEYALSNNSLDKKNLNALEQFLNKWKKEIHLHSDILKLKKFMSKIFCIKKCYFGNTQYKMFIIFGIKIKFKIK